MDYWILIFWHLSKVPPLVHAKSAISIRSYVWKPILRLRKIDLHLFTLIEWRISGSDHEPEPSDLFTLPYDCGWCSHLPEFHIAFGLYIFRLWAEIESWNVAYLYVVWTTWAVLHALWDLNFAQSISWPCLSIYFPITFCFVSAIFWYVQVQDYCSYCFIVVLTPLGFDMIMPCWIRCVNVVGLLFVAYSFDE